MIQIPGPIQPSGLPQMRELQQKLNDVIDTLRAMRPVDSPTVKHEATALGTMSKSAPPAPAAAEEVRQVWL